MNKPKTTITAWPMNDDWNSVTGSWSRNTIYSEVAAEYTLTSHVDDLIAEARDAALKEAADVADTVYIDSVNAALTGIPEQSRVRESMANAAEKIRIQILALRTEYAMQQLADLGQAFDADEAGG